ncbi:MAG TPA: crosslink repair DNA glycosylase YcaQ family protein [Acidimicrobiales bacterium]|nr:crosslink repair DNA glycosylase YcaQ family protein [Acidimicrobiales bacterium]
MARRADVPTVSRAQVLAHRVVAHGLDRTARDADDLAVVDLGLQDSPAGAAVAALAARLPGGPARAPAVPGDWLLVWSVRGAPHHHRRSDLQALARALWPADEADAAARIAGTSPEMRAAGLGALGALRATAEAMAAVVTGPTVKGDASTLVTAAAPEGCSAWCRGCQVVHVQDQLMRLAALPAGLSIDPGTSPPVLRPLSRWAGVPAGHEGGGAVIDAYLRVHGPATPGDVAAYLQTTQRAVKPDWPDGLAEVRVGGRRAWLPEDRLDDLLGAPAPDLVRLLPRSDPWLLARDRELVVPGKAHRKALWPVLGAPGGVLVDGEVVATWRTRAAGGKLDIVVAPFGTLPARVRRAVDDEAALVAAGRGAVDVRVRYGD